MLCNIWFLQWLVVGETKLLSNCIDSLLVIAYGLGGQVFSVSKFCCFSLVMPVFTDSLFTFMKLKQSLVWFNVSNRALRLRSKYNIVLTHSWIKIPSVSKRVLICLTLVYTGNVGNHTTTDAYLAHKKSQACWLQPLQQPLSARSLWLHLHFKQTALFKLKLNLKHFDSPIAMPCQYLFLLPESLWVSLKRHRYLRCLILTFPLFLFYKWSPKKLGSCMDSR